MNVKFLQLVLFGYFLSIYGSVKMEPAILIEVELGQDINQERQLGSIAPGKMEAGSKVSIEERGEAFFGVELNDENSAIQINEAFFDIYLNDMFTISVGKKVLPFGILESGAISDPLILDYSETKNYSLSGEYNKSFFKSTLSIYHSEEYNNFKALISSFELSVKKIFKLSCSGRFDLNGEEGSIDLSSALVCKPIEKLALTAEVVNGLLNQNGNYGYYFEAQISPIDFLTIVLRFDQMTNCNSEHCIFKKSAIETALCFFYAKYFSTTIGVNYTKDNDIWQNKFNVLAVFEI